MKLKYLFDKAAIHFRNLSRKARIRICVFAMIVVPMMGLLIRHTSEPPPSWIECTVDGVGIAAAYFVFAVIIEHMKQEAKE